VDIGSGCGLNVLALLGAGYDHVVAMDQDVHVALLTENISAYMPSSTRCSVVECDWVDPKDSFAQIKRIVADNNDGVEYPDVIVCSECLYASASAEPLLQAIDVLSGIVTEILVCNQYRSAMEKFLYFVRSRSTMRRQYRIEVLFDFYSIFTVLTTYIFLANRVEYSCDDSRLRNKKG
jgi:predicted nicotinamide N-methyase